MAALGKLTNSLYNAGWEFISVLLCPDKPGFVEGAAGRGQGMRMMPWRRHVYLRSGPQCAWITRPLGRPSHSSVLAYKATVMGVTWITSWCSTQPLGNANPDVKHERMVYPWVPSVIPMCWYFPSKLNVFNFLIIEDLHRHTNAHMKHTSIPHRENKIDLRRHLPLYFQR